MHMYIYIYRERDIGPKMPPVLRLMAARYYYEYLLRLVLLVLVLLVLLL